jgi:aminoglycoside phosphotransferase (APT) family kinase protein
MSHAFDTIPADRRDAVQTALTAAFGPTPIAPIQPVAGGASGALTFRIEAGGKPHLLRVEGRRTPLRNPHQYACMRIASDAGIAPPVRHIDEAAGIAIMDFIATRPLEQHAGGGLAQAAGALIARLQATPTFPAFIDYFAALTRMLAFVRNSNLFAPGLLDPHIEAFARIHEAYPATPAPVSTHNDPNPRNLLSDGSRLWLIDWETAYRNDPLVDVAILLDQLAPTPALEEALLHAWHGGPLDAQTHARLAVIRPVTRLYYAGLTFVMFAGAPRDKPLTDLAAPTVEEFRAMVDDGRLSATGADTLLTLGKMQLAGFLAGIAAPGFEDALVRVRNG